MNTKVIKASDLGVGDRVVWRDNMGYPDFSEVTAIDDHGKWLWVGCDGLWECPLGPDELVEVAVAHGRCVSEHHGSELEHHGCCDTCGEWA